MGTLIAKPQGSGRQAPVEEVGRAEEEDTLQGSGEDQWDEAGMQITGCAPMS